MKCEMQVLHYQRHFFLEKNKEVRLKMTKRTYRMKNIEKRIKHRGENIWYF